MLKIIFMAAFSASAFAGSIETKTFLSATKYMITVEDYETGALIGNTLTAFCEAGDAVISGGCSSDDRGLPIFMSLPSALETRQNWSCGWNSLDPRNPGKIVPPNTFRVAAVCETKTK